MKTMKMMVFALLAMIVGCKDAGDHAKLLRGREWQLKSVTENGKAVTNPQELPTIIFTDSTALYGSAGCNRFFGTYTLGDKDTLTIKTGGVTMMYCPDMAFEDQYLKALGRVKTYSVSENELKLMGQDNNLVILYGPVDTTRRVGVAKDAHGCNAAAGYTWSEVRQDCIRIFEEGVQLVTANDTTLAAYVVFSADSLKAEVFLPNQPNQPVLDRRNLSQGAYAWNVEDDDTWNVRQVNGRWVIEKRGEVIYTQTNK